jgi:hypothetical protein
VGHQPFKRSHGRVKVALQQQERELLARLLDDVSRLLDASAEQAPTTAAGDSDWAVLEAALSAPPPQDPAVARLLPEGNREDADLAEGFRRLTEHGLRERKRTGLETAAAALRRTEPVVLDKPEAAALLKGLTDVRLVIAERIGLHTDEDAEMLHAALQLATRQALEGDDGGRDEEQQEWLGAAALYDALTWWQESLVGALR